MTERAVATRDDRTLALYELETRFAMATKQRELLENYIRERLKPGKHFYKVDDEPGRKPSLTKEGAELICLPHALKAHYHWVSGPDNPPLDDTPYQITMNCELEANGQFAGEGIGSASSHQTKTDGSRKVRQKDPGLRHNATIKMACKSAYIAACLNATAASEFFTQDLEDEQTGDKKDTGTREHWCEKHKTNFFKSKKMPAFAHPIKGTDPVEWCNEHKEAPKAEPDPSLKTTPGALESISSPSEGKTGGEQPAEKLIDLDWVRESLDTLYKKKPAMWSVTQVVAFMKRNYKVEGDDPVEMAGQLDKGQAANFHNKIQEGLDK